MSALLVYYFMFGTGAIVASLLLYKFFDKMLDFIHDFINSFD